MPVKSDFNKENIDVYLNEFAEECKKLDDNKKPIILILIGGASVLLNYNFRKSTGDIDVFSPSFASIDKAINNTAKRLNFDKKWLNDDFKKTSSFSEKINDVSVLYKKISNVLEIRTINSEYLVAMKLMSNRIDKYDLSDIAGIFWEHYKNNNPLKKKDIENAVIILYGSLDKLPKESVDFLNGIYKTNDYERLFLYMENRERETRKIFKKLEKDSIRDMVFTDNDVLKSKLKSIINEKFKNSDNIYLNNNDIDTENDDNRGNGGGKK